MQFIPIVERATEELLPLANQGWTTGRADGRPLYVQAGSRVTDRSVARDGFGRFLIDVFDEWVGRDVGEVFVQMFDVALANWYGEPPGVCVYSKTCGLALALEHNGDLYSCDHYVEPDHLLGNITETPIIELIGSDKQRQFGLDKSETLPQYCLDCDVRFACHGGCPRNRFTNTPDGEPGLNYLCPSYQTFFHHIDPVMKLMCPLLVEDRAPSEVVALGIPASNTERTAASRRLVPPRPPEWG